MPYKRRFNKSKKSRKSNVSKVAYKALALAKTTQKQIEYKFHQNQPSRVLTTTGAVDLITNIAEGDSSLTRTGLKISPTSLLMKIRIRHGDNGLTPPILDPRGSLSRILVVRDLQQDADTPPTVADVLVTGTVNVMAPYQRLIRNRFEILFDKCYKTNPNAANTVQYDSVYLKLSSNRPVYYNGTTANDIQKNGIYVLTMCDDAVYSPSLYYWFRMRFADL